MSGRRGLFDWLGLGRPELRAWAMYDWANSAFVTVVITAIYPLFFQRYAAQGDPSAASRHAVATSVALVFIALLAPFLGALADQTGAKKTLLGSFLLCGVTSTALLALVGQGEWLFASALFIAANIAVTGSFVFYDSLLPHVARQDEIDRVSTAGYALGYFGGGLLLGLCLVIIQRPTWFGLQEGWAAAKVSFVLTAIWWLVFARPLFRHVPEPPVIGGLGARSALAGALGRLKETFAELSTFRHAFLLLGASMVYLDGVGTIYRMGVIFGAELGLDQGSLIASILLVQFLAVPFAFLFGALARRIGSRSAILCGLAVYLAICVFAYFVHTATQFFVLAGMVATVQGGVQALSRSLFASLVPRHKSSEFFGVFAVFERFAGMGGSLVFAWVIELTGATRHGILAIIVFFVLGGLLLLRVDVGEGQKAARHAELLAFAAAS